jgi:hypothetical protein
MIMKFAIILLAIIGLINACSTPQLSGIILDPGSNPISNANIKLISYDGTQELATARSSGNGKFRIKILPDYNLKLSIEASRYCDLDVSGIWMGGNDPHINFSFNLLKRLSNCDSAGDNGAIIGKIYDTEGKPLAGTIILLVGTSLGAASNWDGSYMIENIPAGFYDISARSVGYPIITHRRVCINSRTTININFVLSATVIKNERIKIPDDTLFWSP